jgi:hypothetical protein
MEPLQLSMWTHYGRGFRWKGFHSHGRACKIYTKMTNGRWNMICHIGLLDGSGKCMRKVNCS